MSLAQFFRRHRLVQWAVDHVTGGITELSAGSVSLLARLPKKVNSSSDFEASILNHATSTYNYCGYDDTDGLVWVRDDTGGVLRQGVTSNAWATQAGVTWSGSKTLPQSPNAVLYSGITKMLRFGDYIYLLAKDSVTNLYGVYRASPAAGNTAFSWSAPLIQMTSATATGLAPCFTTDGTNLYLGEYGDPVGGPTAWKSANGTDWSVMYTEVGLNPNQRHIHAIAADPYVAGSLWMTMGDANAAREVMHSTDYGATWSVFETNAAWQAVQISFSPKYIYFAGDSSRGHVYVVERTTNTKWWICQGLAKNLGVPAVAALGDTFYTNGWIGCCNPATDEYYFSLQSDGAGGNIPGLFIVPHHGASPILIDKLSAVASPVVIKGGMIWYGRQRRPVRTVG